MSAGVPGAQGQAEVQKGVQAADDERIRATLAGDIAALRQLYAPDLTYVHASGVKDTRDSLLANLQAGTVPYRALRRDEASVRLFGDTAVMQGSFTADVLMAGVERSFAASFTSVWLRGGEAWVMVAWQATSIKR